VQKDFNERQASGGKAQATAFDPRDLVPEPIFCCDADGRFVWVNHAAEKLTGYATVQLLGQPFSMLIAPSKRRRLVSFFVLRHRRDQEESERDVPILTREGRTVWVGVRVRRVRTLHGRIGFVACAHDLHNIVFEIERLRRESRELEARAAEAASAAKLKGEFLAAMSQEIRAPMDGVLGMTRLLLESNLDRDQRTFAEVIQSSGEQLLRLVNDILEFSRIEAGKIEMVVLDFDVRVTLDGVGTALQAARTKGITFSRSVHHDVPSHLQGDPGRLRQVLNQIVGRLVDCMDRGEISIWATLTEETPHDVTLRFSVSYAGHTPSVDLEELAQVFGSDPDKSRRMDGEALGMAISRQLVMLMGGRTGVESQARGGSIWFQMPFKRIDVDAPAPAPLEVQLGGQRVLVADPSVGMRMAICEMLSTWGCIPDEAEEGEYALNLLREAARKGEPYRVVIADMNLPGLDGRALARAIHADESLEGTLLMALTAVGRRGDASKAQEMGYSAYLLKPFEPTHLHDALIEVVHRGPPSIEAQIGSAPAIVTRHSVAEARRQRLRILVVEDNPVNQLVAVAALRRAGYRPQTAASASEAIQDHALNPFDLIFMDLELPDLDGIEATAEIRRMEEGRVSRTPIVALTGHDQPEVHRRCLAEGMKEVLVKPLDLDALCAGIDRWTQPDTVRPVVEPVPDLAPPPEPAIVRAAAPTAPVEILPAPARGAPSGGGTQESELLTTWDGERAVEGSEMGALPIVDLSRTPAPPIPAPEFGVVHLPAPAEMGAAEEPAPAPAPPPAESGTLLDASNALAAADAQTLSASAPRIVEMRPAPPAYESAEQVLDEARLESSCMGNPELKNILIRTFLHHIRPRLRRLRDVAEAQDAKAVEFEAHGLKGMSATIGAACCAEAFSRIERLGREKRLEPLSAMLDYAEVEVGRVETVIGARKAA
jgi:two-component system, sensor histidine kinase and response regulator